MSEIEKKQLDKEFYERADAHISLANDHINAQAHPELASNSLMYAASRFNAWISAAKFKSAEEMMNEKKEILDFYTVQYRRMLEENFDNYAEYYEQYMGGDEKKSK